jgi:hypothetical protein
MAQDLRSFLDQVTRSRPQDVQIVSREVEPAYEITAIVATLEREAKRRPVLVFEKVKGSPFSVLTNLHGAAPASPWRWASVRRRCSGRISGRAPADHSPRGRCGGVLDGRHLVRQGSDPRSVELWRVHVIEALPRSQTGKIQKWRLPELDASLPE